MPYCSAAEDATSTHKMLYLGEQMIMYSVRRMRVVCTRWRTSVCVVRVTLPKHHRVIIDHNKKHGRALVLVLRVYIYANWMCVWLHCVQLSREILRAHAHDKRTHTHTHDGAQGHLWDFHSYRYFGWCNYHYKYISNTSTDNANYVNLTNLFCI